MIKLIKLFSGVNKYIILAALTIVTSLWIYNRTLVSANKDLKSQVDITTANLKAEQRGTELWKDKYGQEHATTLLFRETLSSFKQSQDSITNILLDELHKNKTELKNVRQAIYQNTRVDTILERNYIIPTMPDTTLDFSNEHVHNIVKLSPTHQSSHISLEDRLIGTLSAKKETINTPKKFFLWRWFQKKHTLIEADLYHTNPLIQTKAQKIIQIQD